MFSKHARLFVEAVREQGATPILLMTHAYERVRHVDLDLIARAHQDAARSLDVAVAPSGLVLGADGTCAATKLGALLSRDKEHPLPAGMLATGLAVKVAVAEAAGDARAASASQLAALAQRAIEGGALKAGAAVAPPEELAGLLASCVQAGRSWWRTYPARPEVVVEGDAVGVGESSQRLGTDN